MRVNVESITFIKQLVIKYFIACLFTVLFMMCILHKEQACIVYTILHSGELLGEVTT